MGDIILRPSHICAHVPRPVHLITNCPGENMKLRIAYFTEQGIQKNGLYPFKWGGWVSSVYVLVLSTPTGFHFTRNGPFSARLSMKGVKVLNLFSPALPILFFFDTRMPGIRMRIKYVVERFRPRSGDLPFSDAIDGIGGCLLCGWFHTSVRFAKSTGMQDRARYRNGGATAAFGMLHHTTRIYNTEHPTSGALFVRINTFSYEPKERKKKGYEADFWAPSSRPADLQLSNHPSSTHTPMAPRIVVALIHTAFRLT